MISILALIMFASTHHHIFCFYLDFLFIDLSFVIYTKIYGGWLIVRPSFPFWWVKLFLDGWDSNKNMRKCWWSSSQTIIIIIMILHYFSKCYNIFCQIFGLVYAFFFWCVLMFLFVFNVVWRKELSTWNCCNSSRSFHVKFYFAEYVVWLFWYILDEGSIIFWISYWIFFIQKTFEIVETTFFFLFIYFFPNGHWWMFSLGKGIGRL